MFTVSGGLLLPRLINVLTFPFNFFTRHTRGYFIPIARMYIIQFKTHLTSTTLPFSSLYFLFDFSQKAIPYKLKSKNYKLKKGEIIYLPCCVLPQVFSLVQMTLAVKFEGSLTSVLIS